MGSRILAAAKLHDSEVVPGLRIVGLEDEGAFVTRGGDVEIVGFVGHEAEGQKKVGRFPLGGEHGLEIRRRLGRAARPAVGLAAVVSQPGIARLQLEGAVEGRDGFFVTLARREIHAARVERSRRFGFSLAAHSISSRL